MRIREEMGSIKPFTRVSMVLMQENRHEWEEYQQLFSPLVDAVAYVDYLDHNGQSNPERALVAREKKSSKFCCPQLWQRMFIHPDGIVTPCCIDSSRELVVGNINDNTPMEIWHSAAYRKLRDAHSEGNFDAISVCAQCPLAYY